MTESSKQFAYIYLVSKQFVPVWAETRAEADIFFKERFGYPPAENQFIERRHPNTMPDKQ